MKILITNYLSESCPSICTLNAQHDLPLALSDSEPFLVRADRGLSIKDRALNYGDGCFTSIYAELDTEQEETYCHIFLLAQHFERLCRDCNKIGIDLDLDILKQWFELGLRQTLWPRGISSLYQTQSIGFTDHQQRTAAAVKVLVSRGCGGRGYELPVEPETQVVISVYRCQPVKIENAISPDYKFSVRQAKMMLSSQVLLAGVKHLNRLEQILAKRELMQQDCDDLLLCDHEGMLVEATAANLFYLKNAVWYTPQISTSGVDGVMRNAILSFMQEEGIEHKINKVTLNDIIDADAIFLCNAIKCIVPVSSLSKALVTYQYNTATANNMFAKVYNWLNATKVVSLKGNS